MKKALKIIGITLASLLGLVVVVAGIALAMIFSSDRLAQLVKKYAPQYISCDLALDKAHLTLFKAFPNVGIDIENVAFINPMNGAPSDTLAKISNLIVVIDVDKLRKENEIEVKKCIIEKASFNLFTDSMGQNNYQVFNTKKDNDTTQSTFNYLVDLEELKLKDVSMLYTDCQHEMLTHIQGIDLNLKGNMQGKDIEADLSMKAENLEWQSMSTQLTTNALEVNFDGSLKDFDQIDGMLQLASPDVSLSLNEPYLQNDTLRIDWPVQLSISNGLSQLDKVHIGLNRYLIDVDGHIEVAKNNDIDLDLKLSTNTLIIEDVLTYLPENTQRKLDDTKYTGKLRITEASVRGTYNDSLVPKVSAKITTDNAQVAISALPYPFTHVNLDADLNLDLNNNEASATIHDLKTQFSHSNLSVKGLVDHLFDDIVWKLRIKGNVPAKDVKIFLPEKVCLAGHTTLDLATNFTLRQLKKTLKDYDLDRLKANGTLRVQNFTFNMDTIQAAAPKLNLTFALPASNKTKGQRGAYISLASEQLETQVGKTINVVAENPDIKLNVDKFKNGFEKMDYNAELRFSRLEVVYDSIVAHADAPVITMATSPEKNTAVLNVDVVFQGENITSSIGKAYALDINSLKINASLNQNKAKTDFLDRWNPVTEFIFNDGNLRVERIDENIHIADIDFLLNSHRFDFKKSTFFVGRSDFNLQGNIVGINEWMEDHKNLMKGEFRITSKMLDLNEIMDLTSGWGTSSDSENVNTWNKEDNPFMVPEGIDFDFNIQTENAVFNNFDLNHLGGGMTIKDGTLVLQEIGFTNKAAEMQLTAMYQSPRRNNLFLAIDFHLLNVQIGDLLDMIPYIDTLVPMLKTFDGQAEFHIGAETYLKSNYEPKISTLHAAADIEGKNLYVNDKFTFTEITDKLNISTNGEYRIDSLDVQLTALKNVIDLWPSQIDIGKYKVTVDGRMNLDQTGEYHLSVTQSPLPSRFGLKVSGPLNQLDYKLEKCKYPNLYKPKKRSDTEEIYLELKKRIADSLKENVK